jgi:hypothetical protein
MHDYCDVLFRHALTSEPSFLFDRICEILARVRRRNSAGHGRLGTPWRDKEGKPEVSTMETVL